MMKILLPLLIGILLISMVAAEDNETRQGNFIFSYRDNGLLEIRNNNEDVVALCSEILTGNLNGNPQVKTVLDYEWQRVRSGDNFYYSNFDLALPWQRDFIRTKDGFKIADRITNNYPWPIVNAKLWFGCTVPEGLQFRYHGNNYFASFKETYHLTGDRLPEDSRVEIGMHGLHFDWSDLYLSGMNVTDLYLGNASLLGYDNQIIFAIGATKGNGMLRPGQTFEFDPQIISTPEHFANTSGVIYNQWTSCSNARYDDGAYATETTVGENCSLTDYNLTVADSGEIPSQGVVVRLYVNVDGRNTACLGPVTPQTVAVMIDINGDGAADYFGDYLEWDNEDGVKQSGIYGWYDIVTNDLKPYFLASEVNNTNFGVILQHIQTGSCFSKGVDYASIIASYNPAPDQNTTYTNIGEAFNTTSLAIKTEYHPGDIIAYNPFDAVAGFNQSGNKYQPDLTLWDLEASPYPPEQGANLSLVPSKYGTALYVPASGYYHVASNVNTERTYAITDRNVSFSFSIWLDPAGSGNRHIFQRRLVGGAVDYRVRVLTGGTLQYTYTAGGSTLLKTGTINVDDDEEHEVAVIINESDMCGWVDGVFDACNNNAGVIQDLGGFIIIGGGPFAGFGGLTGYVDNFIMWNHVLSESEILSLNSSGPAGLIYPRGERNFTFTSTTYDVMNFSFQATVPEDSNLTLRFYNGTDFSGNYLEYEAFTGNNTATVGINSAQWILNTIYKTDSSNVTTPYFNQNWEIMNGSLIPTCTYTCPTTISEERQCNGLPLFFTGSGDAYILADIVGASGLYKESTCTIHKAPGVKIGIS